MPFHEAATDAAATAATPCFVAYYRVSTNRQGRSGLGLDAQRAAVAKYVAGAGGVSAAAVAALSAAGTALPGLSPGHCANLRDHRAEHGFLLPVNED